MSEENQDLTKELAGENECNDNAEAVVKNNNAVDTLIISEEEELDPKPAPVKKEEGQPTKFVWVSNITKETKAVDLKKLFNAHAVVVSAKIVTNGKAYFGYIGLETNEMVEKCVKELNNYKFGTRKILVSRQRPDLRASNVKVGMANNKPPEDAVIKKKKVEIVVEKPAKNEEPPKRVEEKIVVQKDDEKVRKLTKELRDANSEIRHLRRKLDDTKSKLDSEVRRSRDLQRQLDNNEIEMRSEKRRLSMEREQIQKRDKVEQIRYDADRALLNRELDECKKLREYLQRKIDELGRKRRMERSSRSPLRKRTSSPMRSEEAKQGRASPPPPPKLTLSKRQPIDKRQRYRPSEPSGRPMPWSPTRVGASASGWGQQQQAQPPPPPQFSFGAVRSAGGRDHLFYPQFKNGAGGGGYNPQFPTSDRRY